MPTLSHRHARQVDGIVRGKSSILGTIAIAAAMILALMLGTSVILTIRSSGEQRIAQARSERTMTVLDMTADIRIATVSTLRGERGYLLTGDTTYLEPYFEGIKTIEETMPQLGQAVSSNPEQMRRITELGGMIETHIGIISSLVALEGQGKHDEAITRIRSGISRNSIEAILDHLEEFDTQEEILLAGYTERADNATKQSALFEYLLGLVGFLILALGCIVTIILKRTLEREAALRRQMQQLASVDELTGLWNRRHMFDQLDRQVAIARRSGRPFALAILDIDHFKRVNDTHGHPAGDEVIRRVAQMTQQMMREVDLVGRLGGEEFIIAFPDCTARDALAACERLREGIAALPIILPEGRVLSITVSSGVAALSEEDDRTIFIARADQALYDAKKGGRDQVRLAA